MSIYTKTGDSGYTSLFGNKRLAKCDLQIEAYGSVDELSSFIGLVHSIIKNKKHQILLIEIQKNLYKTMSVLALAKIDLSPLEKEVKKIEQIIDRVDSRLPRLNRFILPNGVTIASWFHILRTVCRRTERNVIRFFLSNKKTNRQNTIILQYLNRLSDFFFIFARHYNKGKDQII